MEIMFKFAVILALFVQTTRQEGCNIAHFRSWDPVVFSTTYEILYPPVENDPTNRNITLPIGETIIISCKGGHFNGINTTSRTVLATCNQDSQLEVQDRIVDFDNIDCVNFEPQIAEVTTTSCGPNSVMIHVGFPVGLNIKFVPQMDVCFDVKNLSPLYANYNLTKSIGFIKSYLQTRYIIDYVYNISVDFEDVYDYNNQQALINRLLGLPVNSIKYVDPGTCKRSSGGETPGFCFSRRPLTYRGGFPYIPQQHASFRYINIAPQWYFIDYNLNKLEYNVIDFVKKNKLDIEVYTGTYGVATLPHATTGEAVELFLYVSGKTKAVPVPLMFWKLIYDPLALRATVFLIVNDPYQTDVTKNVICNDISDGIKWLTWDKHNVTKGYSYACTYEDARKKISYLPPLAVEGPLV